MGNPIMVVYTKPANGRESEYNDWYDDIHLPDIIKIDGFVSARRFKIAAEDEAGHNPVFRYLAIYEIEEGRLEDARAALARTLAESRVAEAAGEVAAARSTDTLHADRHVAWYEQIAALGPEGGDPM